MPTILVIDDNDNLREMVAETLRKEGMTVVTAANGQEGLREAAEVVPDLIVSDISMPGMDGFELRKQLNELPGLSSIPFLFISAHLERERIREGMRLGADDYLTKPFTITELTDVVRARLERHDQTVRGERERIYRMSESLQLIFPHEISTPLSQLIVASHIMPEMEREELAPYLEMVREASARLNRLTKAFRDLTTLTMCSQDSTMGFELRMAESRDLSGDVEWWLEDISVDLEAGDRLERDFGTLETTVRPAFLQRVIVELVRNALSFSNGPVTLKIRTQAKAVDIEVIDHGPGFNPSTVGQVPFMQIDRMKREQQGLGLGLFLTRRIVDLFGGTMKIESGPENGTHVRVHIPG